MLPRHGGPSAFLTPSWALHQRWISKDPRPFHEDLWIPNPGRQLNQLSNLLKAGEMT